MKGLPLLQGWLFSKEPIQARNVWRTATSNLSQCAGRQMGIDFLTLYLCIIHCPATVGSCSTADTLTSYEKQYSFFPPGLPDCSSFSEIHNKSSFSRCCSYSSKWKSRKNETARTRFPSSFVSDYLSIENFPMVQWLDHSSTHSLSLSFPSPFKLRFELRSSPIPTWLFYVYVFLMFFLYVLQSRTTDAVEEQTRSISMGAWSMSRCTCRIAGQRDRDCAERWSEVVLSVVCSEGQSRGNQWVAMMQTVDNIVHEKTTIHD